MAIGSTWRRVGGSALSLAVLCGLAACGPHTNGSRAEALQAVRAADVAVQKAVAARDLEQIVSFYAEDAVMMPTAEPEVVGKAAIRREWQHVLAIPDFRNEQVLTRVEVAEAGDMAYSAGTYRAVMRGEDGQLVTEPGKWLSVWKRQADGAWKIVVDTYNTDIPPPDHK